MSAPQLGTWRRFVYDTTRGLKYLRAYWGERFVGATSGLLSDMISEGVQQAIFQRFPGHPDQAPDSLDATGKERDLYRFRGETAANFIARQLSAWADYAQAGTPQQLVRVLNQWGRAGWPATWVDLTLANLTETPPFLFTIDLPFGSIVPAWTPEVYGGGKHYGDPGFYYGVGASTDIPMLLYLVRKWKPSRSKGTVTVHWGPGLTDLVSFTV